MGGGESLGKSLLERSLVISHWSLVSKVSMVSMFIRLKASIPFLHANSIALYDFQQFSAISADSIHLKKPSRWPEGPK
jgi:hypothetical protein